MKKSELETRLSGLQTEYDLLKSEMIELRKELNDTRWERGRLENTVEDLVADVSLMEEFVRELKGEEPGLGS